MTVGDRLIAFPLSTRDVASLLVYSEGVPSFSDTSGAPVNRPRAHALRKHYHTPFDLEDSTPPEQALVTMYRDFTEMCHAGVSVLNSAWGQFAIQQAMKKGPGTRAAFETDMPMMLVEARQRGQVGIERMAVARMILEAAPDMFGVPIKIHSFFPRRNYKYGRPWCEFRAPGGGSPVMVFDLPLVK